ncbi:MAG: hypothetical protein AB8G23_04245 [Myxococcota bacterium]
MSNFDEALERFHLNDLEYSGGLASHGPMGAEALEALGHQALIPAFLDIYVPRLPPAEPGRALSAAEEAAARGEIARRSDWVATFEAELAEGDWRDVVAARVPDLLPGLFAAAGHGFLRVAHGVRSLLREDSPLRRRELARGLAHWATRYQTLPGTPGKSAGSEAAVASLPKTIAAWPWVGEEEARAGYFFEIVTRLGDFPDFARAVEAAPLPAATELDAYLDALCAASASMYLAHPEARIAYVHTVTLPSAMRILAPLLEEADQVRAVGYVLQAVGALHSMFGERREPGEIDAEVEAGSADWNEIRYRAACSIQEHAIKMTEACWGEEKRSGNPVFRLAASDAALRLEGTRSAGGC